MKLLSVFLLALILGLAPLGAATTPNQGIFTSVTGKVQVKKVGGKSRDVHADSTVKEGDRIITGKDSTAVVKLFDGSQLTVSPNSRIGLTKLEKPSAMDKVMQFKLFFGKILAKVQKLASSKSSFEIEGGGVVCGVRGTEYSMNYNPDTGKVDVVVLEGTVWASSGGQTVIYHGGQGGTFDHGHWNHPNGSGDNGNGGPHGFSGTNPFYGFNANGVDDFNNIITNLGTGAGDVTGKVGDQNVAGLGSHSLILQLTFPLNPVFAGVVPGSR